MQRTKHLFEQLGYGLAAMSTDTVADSAKMADFIKAGYPILSDSSQAVATSYGVFDLLGDGVAAPAVFVIGTGRSVQWSYIAQSVSDRPSAGRILEEVLRVSST